MAQTTAGALKARIESLGLSVPAYRDQPPTGQALPYVVIQESISTTPDAMEDGALSTGAEAVQVDIYDVLGSENYALVPGIEAGLHGARLAFVGTKLVYVVLVRHRLRTFDLQFQWVRNTLDVDVMREL